MIVGCRLRTRPPPSNTTLVISCGAHPSSPCLFWYPLVIELFEELTLDLALQAVGLFDLSHAEQRFRRI